MIRFMLLWSITSLRWKCGTKMNDLWKKIASQLEHNPCAIERGKKLLWIKWAKQWRRNKKCWRIFPFALFTSDSSKAQIPKGEGRRRMKIPPFWNQFARFFGSSLLLRRCKEYKKKNLCLFFLIEFIVANGILFASSGSCSTFCWLFFTFHESVKFQ